MLPKGVYKTARRFLKSKVVACVATLSVIGLLVSSCGGSVANAVQANVKTQRLEIVDNNGVTRMVMTTIDGSRPSLALVDKDGKDRAWLFLSEDGSPNMILIDGARLVQMDKNGEIRFAQRLDKDGLPVFSLMDADGQVRTMVRLGKDGSPALGTFDAKGNLSWAAP